MAEPVIPPRVKLFIGVIFSNEDHLKEVHRRLVKKYGDIDYDTDYIPFTHTRYYRNMGPRLYKIFFSFEKLIKREDIIKIKLFTNRLEEKVSDKKSRSINIDPGYLTLSNVFLASCKEFFHRVYLSRGIYLENELKYVGKHWEPWEWTYPDYRKYDYLSFFNEVREIYYKQIKKKL